METFLQQQQEAAAAEGINNRTGGGNNVFIWTSPSGNIYYGGNQVLALETLEGDVAIKERTRRLEVAVEATTFVVKDGDIITLNNNGDAEEEEGGKENINTESDDKSTQEDKKREKEDEDDEGDEEDVERGIRSSKNSSTAEYMDENNAELRLPVSPLATDKNTRKTVPAMCAICLGPYEVGDRVTYSPVVATSTSEGQEQDVETGGSSSLPSRSCSHAFHTDCIVEWLAKKNDARPECPCCRRAFCAVVPLTTSDLVTLNTNTGTGGGGGGTSSRTTATSTRSSSSGVHQIPMIALPVNNNNNNGNGNNNNSGQHRMMMILPTPDMVAFRDGYSG